MQLLGRLTLHIVSPPPKGFFVRTIDLDSKDQKAASHIGQQSNTVHENFNLELRLFDMGESSLLTADLAGQYRRIYRAKFKADVAAGEKIPFIFHLCFWGIFIIPILYLSIPHKRRPWLYQARWLVLALCVTLNIWMMRTVRSANFAFSYGAGLCAAWGIVWNLTLLVWTRPQWDAKRVERYPNPAFENTTSHKPEVVKSKNGVAISSSSSSQDGPTQNGHAEPRSRGNQRSEAAVSDQDTNRKLVEQKRQVLESIRSNTEGGGSHDCVVDVHEANRRKRFIYEWQEFPDDAPFLRRLDWALDIGTTMRLTGKLP